MWNTNKHCKCRANIQRLWSTHSIHPLWTLQLQPKLLVVLLLPLHLLSFMTLFSPCSLNHWHCGMTCCFCIVDSELIVWTNSYAVYIYIHVYCTIYIPPKITKHDHELQSFLEIPSHKTTYPHIFRICGYIPVIKSTQNHSHPTTNSTETSTREAFSLSWARSRCAASNLLVSSWSFCVHSSHFQRLMGSWVKWCSALHWKKMSGIGLNKKCTSNMTVWYHNYVIDMYNLRPLIPYCITYEMSSFVRAKQHHLSDIYYIKRFD